METRRIGEDGLTRQQRRHKLAAQGWTLAGWDRATNSWRFQGPEGRHLLVPSHSEADAIRALRWQLQGETDIPACAE